MPAPSRLARRLLDWYAREKRDLPWRRAAGPYRVWVSEIMLQQTTVAAAIPYFERFIRRFPDLASLAAAREPEVLALWSGLGYYHRARNLLRAARIVRERHEGRVPSDLASLRALPGVGPYTAGAILSIGHGIPAPALDANILRVGARLSGERAATAAAGTRRRIASFLAGHIPPREASAFTQAMMDLGAGVCLPRRPRCEACPLSGDCGAAREGLQAEIPAPAPRARPVQVDLAVAALERRGRGGQREVLLMRREASSLMRGMWEFPTAAPGPGEEPGSAAARLIRKLGGRGAASGRCFTVRHTITRHAITLHVHHAARPGPVAGIGRPGRRETAGPAEAPASRMATPPGGAVRWVPLEEIRAGVAGLALTGAARKIARVLQRQDGGEGPISPAASLRGPAPRRRARPGSGRPAAAGPAASGREDHPG